MTWTGWDKLRDLARDFGIIYKCADATISAYVQAVDDIMMYKNTTDAALIFQNEKGSLRNFLNNSKTRLILNIIKYPEVTICLLTKFKKNVSSYQQIIF